MSRAMKEEQETGGRSMISDAGKRESPADKASLRVGGAWCSTARQGHFLPSVCPRLSAAPRQ